MAPGGLSRTTSGLSFCTVSRYFAKVRSSSRPPVSAMEPSRLSERISTRGLSAKASGRGLKVAAAGAAGTAAVPGEVVLPVVVVAVVLVVTTGWGGGNSRVIRNCEPKRTTRESPIAKMRFFCSIMLVCPIESRVAPKRDLDIASVPVCAKGAPDLAAAPAGGTGS